MADSVSNDELRVLAGDAPDGQILHEELICFAVYSAHHAINRAYRPLLDRIGLTYPQYIALMVLWRGDGLTIGELCRRLRMETSTLTPLLKRLERLGHVVRTRGTRDEREVYVSLTPQGRDVQRHAPEITRCIVAATRMDAGSLQELVSALTSLRDGLDDAGKESHA